MQKKPLIILTGPTAVGKSSLSISLAKRIKGEIISADSMQVYKGMDIGTAKIKEDEMEGVPHYLIDLIDPDQEFNVVKFQEYAKLYMNDIYNRGKTPIIVGGTGFYIQSILYDIDFTKAKQDNSYREQLEQVVKEEGKESLYKILLAIDEESAKLIHQNNIKKIIRAIEFYYQTGNKISEHNKEQKAKDSPYNFQCFVLNKERQELYKGIEKRVDTMIEEGLIEEVKGLFNKGFDNNLISMQGLGYKEILAYLKGEYSLDEAIYILKRDTRHFAKRQLTWFKREGDVNWINKDDFDNDSMVIDYILKELLTNKVIEL
ncbi:MAG TPA: tRNA (adenosine(37)-N6)-dimethylallyltransferase MiaA [Clostridiales bacterium]|nr:tRNA (adenosine(37)-N6)-dimethylallyltransferase MiaA [Clostridiales bacterium]